MPTERAERRPKSVRIRTRRLVEQARSDPNPDFEQRALPILRQKIQDFDERFGAFMPVLRDIFDARKEKYDTGDVTKLNALTFDYENPDGTKYNPKHPEILLEIKEATDIIVGIFK
ncbi:MAG TPA: hypothetical protein VES68_02190 [Candidatus Sulfotelmatobacter sp.]|nr:hypothetical protein [Candidatus Sulfotelmatobacter sp.]